MKIKCNCGAIYQLKIAMAGKRVKCKKCEKTFTVPTAEKFAAVAAGQAGLQTAGQMPPASPQMPPPPTAPLMDAPPLPGEAAPAQGPVMSSPYIKPQFNRKVETAAPKKKPKKKMSKEDEILAQYSSGPSLEERMTERRQQSIESERYTNGTMVLLKGLGCFVVSAILFVMFARFGSGEGRLPVILIPFYYVGAQWWLPTLISLYGLYLVVIGIGSFMKVVDIETEDQLPTHFGS